MTDTPTPLPPIQRWCPNCGQDTHTTTHAYKNACIDDHLAEISRLQSALSALTRAHHELGEREAKLRAQVPQWVACSERMPTRGESENTWVLAYSIGGAGYARVRLLNWCHSGEPHWRNEQDDRMWATVTHWMPLPNPPTTSAEEGGT